MFGKRKPEVLVVGAGPVGLLATLLLAKRGVEVQVVDRQWRTGAHSYALALHAQSLRLFEEIGLLEPLLRRGYPVHGVGLYDGRERRAEIRLSDPSDRLPGLLVMPQDVLERLLEEALEQHAVPVQWNHAVSHFAAHSFQVDVTLDKLVKESLGYAVAHTEWMIARTAEIQVPWVIGADGHRSQIRRSLDIDFQELGPAQHFAVFEFLTDQDLQQEVRLVLGDRTTNAVWPLPDGYCRWSFELPDFAVPLAPREKERTAVQIGTAQFPTLTEGHLRLLLQERAPWFQGSIEDVRWRMLVRFERRLASRFGEQRVWLAGDAGHITGPVGMQSMNVGFREARDLVGFLVPIMRGAGQPEELQAYNQQRAAEWRCLLGADGALRAGPQASPWIQQRAHRLLDCLPATGKDLENAVQQLGLQLG